MEEHGASIDVAQRWVEAMDDSDFDSVMLLYDPGATLHAFGGTVSGRARVREYLRSTKIGPLMLVEIQRNDRAHIRWRRGHHEQMETALRVARGQIAEQWLFRPGEVER
jgi:hypothetical protein